MDISLIEFTKKIADFEIETRMHLSPNKEFLFIDGPFDIKKYYESKTKILWLLKEPYDSRPESKKKEESFRSIFNWKKTHLIEIKSNKTWIPILYVSHGILNNITGGELLSKKPAEIVDTFSNIAIINVSKIPAKTTTKWNDLVKSYKKNETLLKKQIEILNPDILIFGNTFDLYKNIFKTKTEIKEKTKTRKVLHNSKEIKLINTHHPAVIMGYKKYVNQVIESHSSC